MLREGDHIWRWEAQGCNISVNRPLWYSLFSAIITFLRRRPRSPEAQCGKAPETFQEKQMGILDSKRAPKRAMFNPNDIMFKPSEKNTSGRLAESCTE